MKTAIIDKDRGFHRNIIRSEKVRQVSDPLFADASYIRHESIYRNYLGKFTQNLSKGHPVKTLLQEHKEILRALDVLDRARFELESSERLEEVDVGTWQLLGQAICSLKSAHLHFHKERDVLFPELVERGYYVGVQKLIAEHKAVHTNLFNLLTSFDEGLTDDYAKNSAAIISMSTKLSRGLRQLIYRENYFLYPEALRLITEERSWEYIKGQYKGVGNFHLAKSFC